MKQFIIGPNDAGQRLDKFLFKAAPRMPAALVYKYIRTKRVKRGGKRCHIGDKLAVGDTVELFVPDEFFAPAPSGFLAAPPDVNILYEDANLLLADKPPGLLVHEDNDNEQDTLIHRIQHYLFQKGEYRPEEEHGFAPALCNRIDRNTCGIVIAAKNFQSLQLLSEKIRLRQLDKRYLCLVRGRPVPAADTLRGYHIKDAASNTVRISPKPLPGAKTALTRYRVLQSRGGLSLLEVELLTGRTHQIRAQMAAAGYPLVGDTKYGRLSQNKGLPHPYQALCAYQLTFSFTGGAGQLDYLTGKTFRVTGAPFLAAYGFAMDDVKNSEQEDKGI